MSEGKYNPEHEALIRILQEDSATLKSENQKMRKFLEWLFEEVFEGSPDGGNIQDKAEEMGILVLCKVNRNDDRYKDWCDEYDSDEMYFPYWTDEAKRAI